MSESKPPADDADDAGAADDGGGVEVDDLEAALADGDLSADSDDDDDDRGVDHDAETADELDVARARARADELADADDLDEVLGRLQAASDEPVEVPRRRTRSPLVSLFVLAFAGYLLAAMWGDFRYWTRADEPEDLGSASELIASGGLTPDLHDHYVVLEGTPDVKNAAVGATKTQLVGYLRVTEGGGRLFASVPRDKSEKTVNNFEGRYVGRIRQLSADRAFDWLRQFYETENVTVPIDVDTPSLKIGMSQRKADGSITVEAARGPATLSAEQEVRLVVDDGYARAQLGRKSFPKAADARAAMDRLGRPYAELPPTQTFHRFVVKASGEELGQLQRTLVAELPEDERKSSADPKVGALVLPKASTYATVIGDAVIEGDTIAFPYGSNTTPPGYDVVDGKLVERSLADGMLRVPLAEIKAVRVEQRITVDPDGFLISVGETPASERLTGILWLVVLGIALANLGSLWVWWRRRAEAGR